MIVDAEIWNLTNEFQGCRLAPHTLHSQSPPFLPDESMRTLSRSPRPSPRDSSRTGRKFLGLPAILAILNKMRLIFVLTD